VYRVHFFTTKQKTQKFSYNNLETNLTEVPL